ncbi:hypothetical protein [Methanosarcina mazei]|jgi:uncharacterized membrane protein YkvA (DUF1232 family)|uniref:Uncharacterized protein n=2 Tax=Methanosarcina mazei TaxID=2209 RepID=A0A0E3LUN6_METMZ|nr:hypothetical protein [Methanosarcina mazei]AKB65586.1 hypothetical protein MSMAS_2390 [Methanosarcina mazei S-6]WIM42142.1 hypothetical protein PSF70_11445 [Methanosarcina mazei]WIM45733.1 hypothetical protein PQQ20_12125 [Methanosarcina mazei]
MSRKKIEISKLMKKRQRLNELIKRSKKGRSFLPLLRFTALSAPSKMPGLISWVISAALVYISIPITTISGRA